jgi:hypothetical protein
MKRKKCMGRCVIVIVIVMGRRVFARAANAHTNQIHWIDRYDIEVDRFTSFILESSSSSNQAINCQSIVDCCFPDCTQTTKQPSKQANKMKTNRSAHAHTSGEIATDPRTRLDDDDVARRRNVDDEPAGAPLAHTRKPRNTRPPYHPHGSMYRYFTSLVNHI